jgi:hypothetical protein
MPAANDAAKVETHYTLGKIRKLQCACTADSGDGSFAVALTAKFEGHLLKLVTDPGTTAPTASYDITLVDQYGADVLEGVGANRHESNTETANIVYTGTGTHPCVDDSDTLTLTFSGNSVNSATVTVVLYYEVP